MDMDKGTFFLSMIVIVAAAGIGWGVWWYYSDAVPEQQSEWQTGSVDDTQAAGKVTIETETAGILPDSEMAVKVFFGNSTKAAAGDECSAVFPLVRTVPKTASVAKAALTELLKGVTPAEEAMGYATVLNAGSALQSVKLENGVLHADFNSKLGEGVSGACAVSAARAEIVQTAQQFPTVKDVVISIDGKTDGVLQP